MAGVVVLNEHAVYLMPIAAQSFSSVSLVTVTHTTECFPDVRVFVERTGSGFGLGGFGDGGFGETGGLLPSTVLVETLDFMVYYSSQNEFKVVLPKTETGYVEYRVRA
jgi:hypothetical protein